MAGKFALIVGNSHYDDPSLSRLKAPDVDVRALESVLKAADVGQFDEVTTLVDEEGSAVRKAIARFFDHRQRDDLLLLYFSGHGVKDEQGHLYLALRDTETALLAGTAIETAFIAGRMDLSYSKRQVLMLDCCHSGAFARGAKAAHGVSVGTAEAFEGQGVGRVVMTATDATQYAWEGDQIIGDAQNSLFTHFVIDGLKTGAADRDGDGQITVDELYDYVREHVIDTTPRQTPSKWTYRQQGDIVLAQNPFLKKSTLPPEIEEAIASKLPSLRLEAVRNLESLLRGRNAERARAALAALRDLSLDDSRRVANAAAEAVRAHEAHEAAEGRPNLDVAAAGVASLPLENAALHEEMHRAVEAETAWRDAPRDRVDSLGSDIFISYAREDRPTASALAKMLAARGWRVWWDRKIKPGEAFDVMIERELCTCKVAVVLWSANSVNATWVRNEARRASRRGVLVPILIDHVEMPLEFENLQAADLTSWQPPADHPELDALFERIGALSPIPAARLAELERIQKRKDEERLERERAEAARAEAERVERERAEAAHRQAEAEAAAAAAADAARLERERAEAARRAEAEQIERERVEAARIERERADAERLERERAEAARRAQAEAARRAVAERIEHERVEAARRAEAQRIERERVEAARLDAEAQVLVQRGDVKPAKTPWWASRPTQTVFAVGLVLAVIVGTRFAGLPGSRGSDAPPSASVGAQPPSSSTVSPAAGTPANPDAQVPSSPPSSASNQPTPETGPVTSAQTPATSKPTDTSPVVPPATAPTTAAKPSAPPAASRTPSAPTDTAKAAPPPAPVGNSSPRERVQQRLRDAEAAATQARQEAIDVDAEGRSGATFRQGQRKEQEAKNLRRSGKDDLAAQAYVVAADRFKQAATDARLIAEDEEQERLKRQAAERGRGQAPPGPPAAQKPAPLNVDVEKDAVIQTLRRYELAYNNMDVAAVRSVFPDVPGESLKQLADARSFALTIKSIGEIKFYTFSESRRPAVAPVTFVYDVVTRSGQRSHEERRQKITLEKPRGTWVITDVSDDR